MPTPPPFSAPRARVDPPPDPGPDPAPEEAAGDEVPLDGIEEAGDPAVPPTDPPRVTALDDEGGADPIDPGTGLPCAARDPGTAGRRAGALGSPSMAPSMAPSTTSPDPEAGRSRTGRLSPRRPGGRACRRR